MGCILCNITSCRHFGTEEEPQHNPFFCETKQEREQFLDELANDIVDRHPEMVERINALVAKLVTQESSSKVIHIREDECKSCSRSLENGGDCEDLNVQDYPCPSQQPLSLDFWFLHDKENV